MNTKSIITIAFSILISANIFGQLKVFSDGSTYVYSYTPNYGHAFCTKVYNPRACAYHLSYGGRDRSYFCAEGWLWTERGGYFGSDFKLKNNINKIESPLGTLKKLNGIQFDYSDTLNKHLDFNNYRFSELKKGSKNQRIGLVAQEVENVLPGIVKTLPDSLKAIAYTDLIALLIEGIKEQQTQIETLQSLVYHQEKDIVEMKKSVEICCKSDKEKSNLKSGSVNNDDTNIGNVGFDQQAELFDNNPNPFTVDTEIQFFVPADANKATIIIHDLQGVQISAHAIQNNGLGSIMINGSELKAGMYVYTLVVDNKIIDSKRMILTSE